MTENEKILAGLLQNVHSWTELKPKLSEYNTSTTDTTTKTTRAGKLFEYFTKLCFLHDSEFSEEYNCKDIYLYDEIPTDLRQKLNLPLVEHGIDLLIVDHDEQIIAVQCKFKNDETVKLNWNADKLGNFFGFARNANLHCIFSNSSDITQVAQNLTDNFKFFSYSHLQNISSATFEKMRTALIGEPIKEIKKPTPHDYQQDAIDAVVNHFKENERGQLILPCGAGKTFTSLWIKEKLQATNTLVLVPSLALLRQIKSNWNEAYNKKFIRLNVCSEKDIDADIDNDIAITHTYEIPGNVTSDKNLVASFLKKEGDKVIFSTYQSLQVVVDALQLLPNLHFDLIIADEAHKTAGFEDQNKFTLVHNNEKVRGVKRLYMTATPRIASPELKAKHSGRIVFLKDMSNPKVFGKEAYRMTFGTAIEKKILVKYKIIAVGVSDTDLKNYIERNIHLTKSESITDYAHNYALNIVMEKYKAFHALTFHSRIKNAVDFAKRHNRLVQDAVSTSISGTQTTSEREKILKAFEIADKAVVSNAKCLTEGVDVPVIDVVYYSDPKNSKIDIVQSAGRALRKAKHGNKEWGFIVVPIFHKDRETVEDAIDKSDYRNLITVIRSLCDQDERLVSEINELAWEKDYKRKKPTIQVTFSDDQTDRVIQFEEIKEKLKNALFNQVIESLKDSWEIHYKEVEEYFNANGNSNIPARYKTKDGFGLGTWCVSQRVNYNKGLLSDGEIKKLQKLKFDFDPDKSLFESDFKKLLEYKENNGHVNVPTMGSTLGRKVNRLRTYYKRGILSQERIERLTEIGFQFIVNDGKSWNQRFDELKDFYEKYGHLNLKETGDQGLIQWCYKQRKLKNTLSIEQLEKLKSIDFDSNFKLIDREDNFLNRLIQLQEYFLKNNSFFIPENDSENRQLKFWLGKIRTKYNKGTLSKERESMLNDIGYSFNEATYEDSLWNEKFKSLQEFHTKFNTFILFDKPDYVILNRWIKFQRTLFKQGKLQEEREKKLISIGYSFTENYGFIPRVTGEKKSSSWDNLIEEIKRYQQQNTSFSNIDKNPDYKTLYRGLKKIKKGYDNGTLSKDRINELVELNYDFTYNPIIEKPKRIDNWQLRFDELKEHYNKTSNFNLSFRDSNQKIIATWLTKQRKLFKQNNLSTEKVNQFQSIGYSLTESYRIKKVQKEKKNDTRWDDKFIQFKAFYEANKTFYILIGDNENKKLRVWIQSQISNYRRGKLSSEQIEKLASIGFAFAINQITKPKPVREVKERKDVEAIWNAQYLSLVDYKDKNGDCNVPRGYGNTGLGNWVSRQRYSNRQNELSKDKIDKLNLIGFQWGELKANSEFAVWMKSFSKLKAFFNKYGHSSPKKSYGDKQLVSWVLQQRHKKRKDTLKSKYFDLLEVIKFEWNPDLSKTNDVAWLNNYENLIKYKEQFGNTSVSQTNKDYKSLGKWVNDQRHLFKKGKMSDFRINKLNDIGFVWVAKK